VELIPDRSGARRRLARLLTSVRKNALEAHVYPGVVMFSLGPGLVAGHFLGAQSGIGLGLTVLGSALFYLGRRA